MILYFDLDKKELVNPPGTSGAIRAFSFIRGDYTPLQVHFLKGGDEVTDITDIVFVIKTGPGIGVEALAIADEWDNPAETTYFTSLLNLNGESLDELIGSLTNKAFKCQISCHYDGTGPITSQLVTANVGGDLHRGDEGTPLELPTPDEWLEARRPAPLELDHVPLNAPASLTITGITSPSGSNPLTVPQGDGENGYPDWLMGADDVFVYWASGSWHIEMPIGGGDYSASKVSTAATPVGLTGWTISAGAGQPVITGSYDIPSVLGQAAIVSHSDDTFTEWSAASLSPLKWLPRTAGILYNRDTFQWERMFIDDSTIQTEILPDQ